MRDELQERLAVIIWQNSTLTASETDHIAEHIIDSFGLQLEEVYELPDYFEYLSAEDKEALTESEEQIRKLPKKRRYITDWEEAT